MSARLVSLLDGPGPPEVDYYLEESHGVSRPLVKFVANVTDIIESRREMSAKKIDRLELQLYLNCPRPSISDARNAKIIQPDLNAFYHAAIIYSRRTVRRAHFMEVQDIVEKAVQNLESTENLGYSKGRASAYN